MAFIAVFNPTFLPFLRGGSPTQVHCFINHHNKKIIHHLLLGDLPSIEVLVLPIQITALHREDKLILRSHGGLDMRSQTGLKILLHRILFKAYKLFLSPE